MPRQMIETVTLETESTQEGCRFLLDDDSIAEAQALILNAACADKRVQELHPSAHRAACSMVSILAEAGHLGISEAWTRLASDTNSDYGPDDIVDAIPIIQRALIQSGVVTLAKPQANTPSPEAESNVA